MRSEYNVLVWRYKGRKPSEDVGAERTTLE